jgi:hypothetical protein
MVFSMWHAILAHLTNTGVNGKPKVLPTISMAAGSMCTFSLPLATPDQSKSLPHRAEKSNAWANKSL